MLKLRRAALQQAAEPAAPGIWSALAMQHERSPGVQQPLCMLLRATAASMLYNWFLLMIQRSRCSKCTHLSCRDPPLPTRSGLQVSSDANMQAQRLWAPELSSRHPASTPCTQRLPVMQVPPARAHLSCLDPPLPACSGRPPRSSYPPMPAAGRQMNTMTGAQMSAMAPFRLAQLSLQTGQQVGSKASAVPVLGRHWHSRHAGT